MKRKIICFGTIFLLAIMIASNVEAGECEYGKVEAWARTLDENGEWGEWRNATVHETLKVHEPFQVKVKVIAKVDCALVDLSLERMGTIKAYEVVEGPSKIMDWIYNDNCSKGWSKTYQWTIRPTGNWTEGTAALNIRGAFYQDGYKYVDFTIIAAYISSEEWEGNGSNGGGNGGGGGIPGFEGALMVTAILAVGAMNFLRKNARNKNG